MNPRGLTTIRAQVFGLAWRLVLYTALLIVGIRGLSMLAKTVLHGLGVHFAHPDGVHQKDLQWPVWAGVIPTRFEVGCPEPDLGTRAGSHRPPTLRGLSPVHRTR
jgi:hypothetical protein